MGWHLNKESQESETQFITMYASFFVLIHVHIGPYTNISDSDTLYFNFFSSLCLDLFKNWKFASCFKQLHFKTKGFKFFGDSNVYIFSKN
jgi:hypothetical protein